MCSILSHTPCFVSYDTVGYSTSLGCDFFVFKFYDKLHSGQVCTYVWVSSNAVYFCLCPLQTKRGFSLWEHDMFTATMYSKCSHDTSLHQMIVYLAEVVSL